MTSLAVCKKTSLSRKQYMIEVSYHRTRIRQRGNSFLNRQQKLCTAPLSGGITVTAFSVCKKTSSSCKGCITEVTSLRRTIDKIIGIIRWTVIGSCYRSFRIHMHTSRGPLWRISYDFISGIHESLIIPLTTYDHRKVTTAANHVTVVKTANIIFSNLKVYKADNGVSHSPKTANVF